MAFGLLGARGLTCGRDLVNGLQAADSAFIVLPPVRGATEAPSSLPEPPSNEGVVVDQVAGPRAAPPPEPSDGEKFDP